MPNNLKEMIYQKYIAPTEIHRERFIGVEAELPIVCLSGSATDHNVSRKAFSEAVKQFGFTPKKFDDKGRCHEAENAANGDIFSFDCSYNNFEISFGKEKNLPEIDRRFQSYVSFMNSELIKDQHLLTGMGINPFYKHCKNDFIPTGRYKMLEGYLGKSSQWKCHKAFHKYPHYGAFSSALQVQLDVEKNNLTETIRIFSLLEPFKTVLFANSVMEDEPDLLCTRDMLWEDSTHGINPHNVGIYETVPETVDELSEYISLTSIFCTERDQKYMFFKPVPFAKYINESEIDCEYYENGTYRQGKLTPDISDIKYLRTYKFTDLTARGTIEFRSTCTQPLSEELSSAALYLGLIDNLPELDEILRNDTSIYNKGYSACELRKMLNKEIYPFFVDKKTLTETLIKILSLAEKGLKTRALGEETYLKPLFARAEQLLPPAREMKQKLHAGMTMPEIVKEYSKI